ncbi:hypothetical protein R3P38DRAFT_3196323 [Favolaschia claudopus]|uniref:Uncharacterized protein n=1 Tax=Favolaschia claudopus TaxID=2862362 RepID=A0AAW0B6V4_9AGAR
MRNDDEEQAHRVLHKLYLAVGADQAPVAALTPGSAMKVLQFGVADEDALV